jgi:magnesium chelatase family protein
VRRRDYRRKLSGPIVDRIDITRHLLPVQPWELRDRFSVPEPSAAVRERVEAARLLQAERYAGLSWRLNAHAPGPALLREWPLSDAAQQLVDERLYGGRLSRRGATRVHRLAWTVADLRGVSRPDVAETEIALRLRVGDPLELASLRRVG